MITRRALLVGACYNDPKIPGVYTDIDTWQTFLQSDLGGAWESSEIAALVDPTLDETLQAVRTMATCDYGFVVFSGHGESRKLNKPWRETVLYFGPHGELSELELNPGTPYCTQVFDCCRLPGEFTEEVQLLENLKSASFEDRKTTRQQFDSEIARAEKGLVKIYAASFGEYAADLPSFSKILIHEASNSLAAKPGVLHQDSAVQLAIDKMTDVLPQQHPEYISGRRLRHYPFALNVK